MSALKLAPPPNDTNQYSDLKTCLDEVILPKLQAKNGDRHLIEFTKTNGTPTLRLLTTPTGKAAYTITKLPDGRLWAPTKKQRSRLIQDNKYHDINNLRKQTRVKAAREILNHPPARDIILSLAANRKEFHVTNLLYTKSEKFAAVLAGPSITPSGTKEINPRFVTGRWNKIARTHFIDPYILQASKDLSVPITVDTHNFLLRNKKLLKDTEGNPVARILLRHIVYRSMDQAPRRQLQSLDNLIATVADQLHIPPDHRKFLSTALTAPTAHLVNPAAAVAATCQLLSQLKNTPTPLSLSNILRYPTDHLNFLNAGTPIWNKWVQAIDRYTREPDSKAIENTKNHLLETITERATESATETMAPTPPKANETHRPKTAPATPLDKNVQELINHIENGAQKAAARKLGAWSPTKHTRTPKAKALDIMTIRRKPAATLIIHRDDTISIRSITAPSWDRITFKPVHLPRPLEASIAYQILDHSCRAFPNKAAHAMAFTNTFQAIASAAAKTAKKVAASQVSTQDPDDSHHLTSRVNQEITKNFLDKETLDITRKLFHSPHGNYRTPYRATLLQYNTAAINKNIFQAMLSTGQLTPLRAYFLLQPTTDPPRKFDHPGQIISELKRTLEFTNAQWRYFCRFITVASPTDVLPPKIHSIQTACQALVEANRPNADPQSIRHILALRNDHQQFKDAEWQHGNPWQAWINVLNRFLEPSQPPHPTTELYQITDALRYYVRNQLPWGPGNWDALLARSDLWHWDMAANNNRYGRYRALQKDGQKAKWASLLDETDVDDITFTPITTGPKLAAIANKMGNCLASYWPNCHENQSRIFTATHKGSLKAAIELVNYNGEWRSGQIQAPHKKTLDKSISDATSKLANLYQQAADSQEAAQAEAEEEQPLPPLGQ